MNHIPMGSRRSHERKKASAFILFSRDNRNAIAQKCPFLSSADILRVLSEQWKKLPEIEKSKYIELAKRCFMVQKELELCEAAYIGEQKNEMNKCKLPSILLIQTDAEFGKQRFISFP